MLLVPLAALSSSWSARHAHIRDVFERSHSPPPPPPLDTWDLGQVSHFVEKVRGINATGFEEAHINGAALHELWLSRTEPTGAAAWEALTKDAGAGAKLELAHRLRGISRAAMAPNPPPPPPPEPSPPPLPGAPAAA